MAHYNIYVEMKNRKPIPKEWIPVIRKIMACFGSECILEKAGFSLFFSYGGWYDYKGDLEDAASDGFITRDLVKFYHFAKENMTISADCWNVMGNEYGPNGWDEFDRLWLDEMDYQRNTVRKIILDREQRNKEMFHVHTWRCGHAGDYSDRDYIERALELGADRITFTDHAPFPGDPFGNRMRISQLPEYIGSMKRLKEEYRDRIDIIAGLEIEYLPSFANYYEELKGMEGIGYLLLGQHFYEVSEGVYGFMLPPEEKNRSEMSGCGNAIIEGIKSGFFDGVAHPDRIFRRRKAWDREMDQIAYAIISEAFQARIPLEINESSLGRDHQFWPEFWANSVCGRVPVLHGLDAHSPEELKLL